MSRWKSVKARQLLAALRPNYSFAFHDNDEVGPALLPQIAKKTGLQPEDL